MYVITFYSYKGGVGRSMALINVGMRFVSEGKRVLFVDFDLEAPGLGSYEGSGRLNEAPGLVDYVIHYSETGIAPDVNGYLSRGSVTGAGEAWFMGAGKQDEGYSNRLGSIDWMELYKSKQGFLLFEDLRAQWKQSLNPDYVLIDSRTGFTDTGGICTRQLPDALCLVAYPTDQNLIGLEAVVQSVRKNAANVPGRARDQHLVISNVPKLDDENDILATAIQRFRERLGFAEPPEIIHHYHSLSLLRQTVFVLDRPNSELSRAYVRLADRLAARNVSDRIAALRRLQEWFASDPSRPGGEAAEGVLRAVDEIRNEHYQDGEVLFWLARVLRRWGDVDQALALLESAIANDFTQPIALSEQILLLFLAGKLDQAREHLHALLDTPADLGLLDIERLIQLGRRLDVSMDLAGSTLIRSASPDARLELAESTLRHGVGDEADKLASALLVENKLDVIGAQRARAVRGEVAISEGRLVEAIKILNPAGSAPADHPPINAFHMATALYWLGENHSDVWMRRGLSQPNEVVSGDPSSAQMRSFGYLVCKDIALAEENLRVAQQRARLYPFVTFSVWHYRSVSRKQFLADCESLQSCFSDPGIRAPFAIDSIGGVTDD